MIRLVLLSSLAFYVAGCGSSESSMLNGLPGDDPIVSNYRHAFEESWVPNIDSVILNETWNCEYRDSIDGLNSDNYTAGMFRFAESNSSAGIFRNLGRSCAERLAIVENGGLIGVENGCNVSEHIINIAIRHSGDDVGDRRLFIERTMSANTASVFSRNGFQSVPAVSQPRRFAASYGVCLPEQ